MVPRIWTSSSQNLFLKEYIVPDNDLKNIKNKNFKLKIVSEHRNNSVREMMNNYYLRTFFFKEFLINILNLEDPLFMNKVIAHVLYNPLYKDDNDLYNAMYHYLKDHQNNNLMTIWKNIKQLRAQRKEITRETASILSRLGKLGFINDYMSIGDVGKTVLSFKESFRINGKIYILNDYDASSLSDILIRGSEQKIGEFLKFDYDKPENLKNISSHCVDLITINQGLHHLPQNKLILFLKEIMRILRPGGLLIVREHDTGKKTAQIPMLDCAHLFFNLLTGVKPIEEKMKLELSGLYLNGERL